MDVEFYIYNNELWYFTADGQNKILKEDDPIIGEIISMIQERYPDAYEALTKIYIRSAKNLPYYQYLIVRRFCKCNFASLDSSKVDYNGTFNFERISCPLRGECQHEGIVCMPRFNSALSKGETRVMELLYKGSDTNEIAQSLFLSPNTVKNHIKNVYAKLGIHEKSEFIKYANNHNMFNN